MPLKFRNVHVGFEAPDELWEHLGGVMRHRHGSEKEGVLIPTKRNMLTATMTDGLVLVVNYLRCG